MLRFSPFTALFNVTGDPAVTVPVPSEDALPVGVQLVGQLGDDARLLCLAADVERVSGGAGADRVATAFR
jgi:amidase